MKFRCERDGLLETLTASARAVSSRSSSLPALLGLRLELHGDELVATGSDLDLTIAARTSVSGSNDGVAVVPSRIVTEILRKLESGRVDVETDDAEARIMSGRSEFSVRLLPAEEFPKLPAPPDEQATIKAPDLLEGLRQVVPAASSDDARPILTGVLLASEGDGLRLVATDSYRLAVRDLPGASVLESGQSVLLPSRALAELTRLLTDVEDLTIRLGEREAGFEVGTTRLTTRLIEGDFPNYRSLIPKSHANCLTVGRDLLLDAVQRVRIMATDATPIRLVQRPESLELVAVNQEFGQAQEEVDAKYEGSELTVAFNAEFLTAGIEATPGDELTLETVDALKPALIRSTDSEDFLYLLMPVRVS